VLVLKSEITVCEAAATRTHDDLHIVVCVLKEAQQERRLSNKSSATKSSADSVPAAGLPTESPLARTHVFGFHLADAAIPNGYDFA
jgi:hypothetical protein